MEDNKINFFSRVIKSLSDFEFYRVIKRESVGKAVLYLVLLSLMVAGIYTIALSLDINQSLKSAVDELKNGPNIPNFLIKNGTFIFEGEEPYIIEADDGSDDNIFIIDTTGYTDKEILDNYKSGLLITKHKIIVKNNEYEIREINLQQFKNFTFSKADLYKLVNSLKYILFTVIIVFGTIGIMIGKFISTLFISLLGLIINEITKAKLAYSDIYKLSIYSITLSTILKLIIRLAAIKSHIEIPYFNLIYYGIVCFFLWKAMTLINEEKSETFDDII